MRCSTIGIGILFLAALTPGVMFAQGVCSQFPEGDPQILMGAVRMPSSLAGDHFRCGTLSALTPETCELYYRVYTDQESSCINTELSGTPPDFLPHSYGSTLRNYETEIIVVGNWPSNLGTVAPVPKSWYIVWDHIIAADTPNYIGYYGAQSDLVELGELGNHRLDPCNQGTAAESCTMMLKGTIANQCRPVNTPLGEIANLGGLGAVPVPVSLGFVGDSGLGFTDPAGRIALEWVPACAQTYGSNTIGGGTAQLPVMGYRLEVFVDRNGNGVAERAGDAGWSPDERAVAGGCGSGPYEPLFDIAPAYAEVFGTHETPSTVVDLVDFTGAGKPLENPAQIEALTFRLRVLFRDDRFDAYPGGRDLIIHPVCSAPSAQGSTVANPALFGEAAGAVPDGNVVGGEPLELSLESNGDVTMAWGASCNVGDTDYAVYEGVLGHFTGHTPRFCSTGGATTKTFTPAPGNTYFLVVPGNSQNEGSYGVNSDFVERPASAAACVPTQNFACREPIFPPEATTDVATSVFLDSATLNGSVLPNGFDTLSYFEWGTTTALGNSTPTELAGNGEEFVTIFFDLLGLSSDTTYYFRIVATSPLGTATGSIESFTTLVAVLPTAITMPPSDITVSSAVLNGQVNPNGFDTSVRFEWGDSPDFGHKTLPQNVGSGLSTVPVSDSISGLSPETTYYYRTEATNAGGTSHGDVVSFQTPRIPTDLVVNGAFSTTEAWTTEGDFHFFQSPPREFHSAWGWIAGGVDYYNNGINNASGRLYQDVTIPADGVSATLNVWYNITTEEPGPGQNDNCIVAIKDTNDNLLASVDWLGNLDGFPEFDQANYQELTFDMTPFIGQTIRIDFQVNTDAFNPTIFRFDDVSLIYQ